MQLKPELDLCVCVNKQHVDACDRVEGEQPSHQRAARAFKRAFPQAEMSRRVVSLLFRWQVVCVLHARARNSPRRLEGAHRWPCVSQSIHGYGEWRTRARSAAGSACQLPGDHVADASAKWK
jgi:hypothetical protein